MKPEEFAKEVDCREAKSYDTLRERLGTDAMLRLLHSSLGITTEAGELADAIKKHVIYGSAVDEDNIVEELGDLLWYVTLACNTVGVTLEEVMEANTRKLRARYGAVFAEEKAVNRNVEIETAALLGLYGRE
jgi:NTP pyrophosphatase (non-canonical NTP hydrolase)